MTLEVGIQGCIEGVTRVVACSPWILGGVLLGILVQKYTSGQIQAVPKDFPMQGYFSHSYSHWKGPFLSALKLLGQGKLMSCYRFLSLSDSVWKVNERHRVGIIRLAKYPKKTGLRLVDEQIRYTIQLSASALGLAPHLEEVLQQSYLAQLRNYLIVQQYLLSK